MRLLIELLWLTQAVFCTYPLTAWITLQSLCAVSTQPTLVLSLGLTAEARVSARSTHRYHRCISLAGEGSKVARIICAVFALCKSAAALSSEPLKLPTCPSWSPSLEEDSQGERIFPLLQFSPFRDRGTVLIFVFFLLSYLVTWWSFLQVYEICRWSVAILWELFHI